MLASGGLWSGRGLPGVRRRLEGMRGHITPQASARGGTPFAPPGEGPPLRVALVVRQGDVMSGARRAAAVARGALPPSGGQGSAL